MPSRALFLLPLVWSTLAFGQLDSNSVTVTASQNTTLQPDQVVFSVSVTAPISSSLDDVVAVLQPLGITAANFAGLSTPLTGVITGGPLTTPPPQQLLQWTFGLPVPIANLKTTLTALSTLQQNLTQKNNGVALSFQIQGTQVSQQLAQTQTCSISNLLSTAQAKAQSLANAAALTLGAVLAMSSSTVASPNPTPAFLASGTYVSTSTALPQVCSLTVKFALTRF